MSRLTINGTQMNCHVSNQGVVALSSGDRALSARQRQFLHVLEKTDTLSQVIVAQLAENINLSALIDGGFIDVTSTQAELNQTDADMMVEPATFQPADFSQQVILSNIEKSQIAVATQLYALAG